MTEEEPQYRAIRLYAPMVAPKIKICPVCNTQLEYWRGGRGNVYLCPACRKVREVL